MNKNYILNEQSLQILEKGIGETVDAVKYSFGPKGRHVIIMDTNTSAIQIVRNGNEILNGLELGEQYSNVVVKMINEILKNLVEKTADGSKTCIILANAMVKEAVRSIGTGINPNLLIKGMEKMVERCIEELKQISMPIETEKELENIIINTIDDIAIAKIISKIDINKKVEIARVTEPVIYIESEDKEKVKIKLGDINDIEFKIRVQKINKVIKMIKLNKINGYVIGGQSAYVKILSKMQNNLHELEIDERVGARLVLKALEVPLKQLAYSSSLEGELISQMVKMSDIDMGYDVNINKLVNMKEAGIIDFTSVLEQSLISAVSIASKIVLTNAVILPIN